MHQRQKDTAMTVKLMLLVVFRDEILIVHYRRKFQLSLLFWAQSDTLTKMVAISDFLSVLFDILFYLAVICPLKRNGARCS